MWYSNACDDVSESQCRSVLLPFAYLLVSSVSRLANNIIFETSFPKFWVLEAMQGINGQHIQHACIRHGTSPGFQRL